jgi:membrane protein YdbS with pleckstrin-like domain
VHVLAPTCKDDSMDDTTRPPRLGGRGLTPVSPKLVPARYIAAIPWYVISVLLAAGCIVLGVRLDWWWMHLIALVPILWCLPGVLLTPRRVRAIGYRTGDDDLTLARGLMFRSVTTTPYGRIQSVEIHEGPVERRYGIARLAYSTASGEADGTIPGFPREDAEQLKELLTRRGIERMQSL